MNTTLTWLTFILFGAYSGATEEDMPTVFPNLSDRMLHYKAHIQTEFSDDYVKLHSQLKGDTRIHTDVEYWSRGDRYMIDVTDQHLSGKELGSYRGGFNGTFYQTLDRRTGALMLSKLDKTPSAFFSNAECLFKPFSFLRDNLNPFRCYPNSLKQVQDAFARLRDAIYSTPHTRAPTSGDIVIEMTGSRSLEFLQSEFSSQFAIMKLLEAVTARGIPVPEAISDLQTLNKLLREGGLHERFKELVLPEEAKKLVARESSLSENERIQLNRLILETAYPKLCPKYPGTKGFKYVLHISAKKPTVPVKMFYLDNNGTTRAAYEVIEVGTVSDKVNNRVFDYPKKHIMTLYHQDRVKVRTDTSEILAIDIDAAADDSVFTIPFIKATHIWDKDANVWIKTKSTAPRR